MLGRIWRRLVGWMQQVWCKIRSPQPLEFRTGNSEPDADNQPNPLSDAGYEQLWMQALDGVAAGWDREKILAHFGKRTEERVLKFWLQRFGRRLLESPVPNRELARRMVLLGGIWAGTTPPETKRIPGPGSVGAKHLSDNPLEKRSISNPNASPIPTQDISHSNISATPNSPTPTHPLAQIAAEIGTALLTRELPPLTEAEYESLFRELLAKTAQGEAAVSAFWQEMSARGTEADWVVWLRGYGKMLLAQDEPNQSVAKALVRLGEFGIRNSEVGIGEGDGESLAKLAGEIGMQMREREVIWEIWEYVEGGNSEVGIRNSEGGEGNSQGGDGDAREWFKRAIQQYDAGDFEGALESFDRTVELKPNDHIAWMNRGEVLKNLGRYEDAVASCDRAVELKPNDHIAWYNRGGMLNNLGRYEDGLVDCNRAIELQPDFPEAWYNRGNALRDLGRHEAALESFDRAIELKPDYPEAWYNQGVVLGNLGRYEEAVTSYDRAIELQPNFPNAWGSRGVVLDNLGRHEAALASFDRTLELKPDDPKAWYNRGITLRSLERFEEAVASCDRAIELQSNFPEAWYNRGMVLDNLGRFEEAVASYDRTLELKPDNPKAWGSRGVTLNNLGRNEEAVASYDRAVELQPDDPDAWYNRGNALGHLGHNEEAVASFDRALEIESDDPEAWINRGIALGHLGRDEEAVASYDRAVKLKPDFYNVWIHRGNAVGKLKASILMPSSLAIQNPQLNKPGYLGKLATYKEGLKHCPRDTHPEGWGLLHYAIGIAHYFRGRVDSRPQPYFRQARTHYLQALKTLTESDFPEQHLKILQDLLEVLPKLRLTEQMEEFGRRGTELLQRLLADPQRPDSQKQKLALKSAAFNQLTVDTLIRQGSFTEALEVAEAGKNACLRWLLYGFEYEPEPPNFAEMRDWVQPGTALVSWHLSPVALTAFVLLPGGELVTIPRSLSSEETIPPRLSLENTIPPSPPSEGGDLDDGDDGEELDSLHRVQQLEDWITRWNREYGEYRGDKGKQDNAEKSPVNAPANTDWRGEMGDRLAELAQLLYVGEIIDILQIPPFPPSEGGNGSDGLSETEGGNGSDGFSDAEGGNWSDGLSDAEGGNWNCRINRLILIPHRDLHRLPLPALFTLANPKNTDKNPIEHLAITTLPSIKMGLNLSPQEITPTSELLAIVDPHHDGFKRLDWAQLEVAAIRQFFPHGSSLAEAEATRDAVTESLKTAPSLLHFAGHGTYNFNAPLAAYLALAGEDKLTLKQLLELPAEEDEDIALVTLAACETAITGNETIASEYVGLVSGFLSRGVPYVVSTLWVVESAASALLVAYFYRQLAKGKPPAIALMSAQSWLRRLTVGKLRRLYRVILAKLPEDDAMWAYLDTEWENLATMNASDRLYDSPYHWAAFTLTGL